MSDEDFFEEDLDETAYAQGRVSDRTYASRSFALKRTNSSDDGSPARFVCKVFDPPRETAIVGVGEEWLVRETEAGRFQLKLLVAREPGNLKELWIHRVPASGTNGQIKTLLNLTQPELGKLFDLIKALEHIPAEGGTTARIDDSLIREIFSNPTTVAAAYRKNPSRFRSLIAEDESARDVLALAARRAVLARFRQMLEDDDFFDGLVPAVGRGSKERVWQKFFQDNPWLLGVSLTSQLLTSWNEDRLEQVVAGSSVSGVGKRADALMRTSGRIKSMVFAEIKTHRTSLLAENSYRPGCWAPSGELAGGVAQSQGTVHRAVSEIGDRIQSVGEDGADIPADFTYLIRPKSVLVVGSLEELRGQGGGDHADKIRSFELYRRNVWEPDVITFDELLARAEWVVETAEGESLGEGVPGEAEKEDDW